MKDKQILDATCGGRSIWLEGQKYRDDVFSEFRI